MEGKYIQYDYLKSFERIDEIIAASDNSFEELDSIPSRSRLTFTNGFYVKCSAVFVDIRESSQLPERHTRPKLAKLYRAFLSEVIAVMLGNENCAETYVIGDAVSGIFDTPLQKQVHSVFSSAAKIASLVDVLNCRFRRNDIQQIEIGIGISYGRALMIKAGYKGSGINEVLWMGDVVNEASKLASYGNRNHSDKEFMVSRVFYSNLSDHQKGLLRWHSSRDCYHGNVIDKRMNKWYQDNCPKNRVTIRLNLSS